MLCDRAEQRDFTYCRYKMTSFTDAIMRIEAQKRYRYYFWAIDTTYHDLTLHYRCVVDTIGLLDEYFTAETRSAYLRWHETWWQANPADEHFYCCGRVIIQEAPNC